jgi:TRAP transporter TAXI family solute receptor
MSKSISLIVLLLAMIGLIGSQTGTVSSTGIEAKKPVFGGACMICPWGAMAEAVKSSMQFYGYDVQICHNCNAADAPRIVSSAKLPPPYKVDPNVVGTLAPPNTPGLGPIDFGATSIQALCNAYHGTGNYANDKPMDNLRLIASIQQQPRFLIVAAKVGTSITDFSQIRAKRWPVRIYGSPNDLALHEILAYYGLSVESVNSAGGYIGNSQPDPSHQPDPTSYDIIIQEGSALTTAPEVKSWSEVIQKSTWAFLDLPDPLLAKLAQDLHAERGNIPFGLLPGIDRPIRTIALVGGGTVVYSRADVPDSFAYDAARALDEHQDRLLWTNQYFFYNVHTVWKACDVPLHPGAAKYYREVGYMK